jgi:uncharacterized protein (TIGR02597 family)
MKMYPMCKPFVVLSALFIAIGNSRGAGVTTDPVGFMPTPALMAESDTYISMPLTRAPEFVGSIQSISDNVITVAQSPAWSANQFVYQSGVQSNHYYVLIGSSNSPNLKEGRSYAVTANGPNSLTVDTAQEDLSSIPQNAQVTLIPYWTPATIFPVSDAGISFAPTISTSAYQTQIRIPNDLSAGFNLPYARIYFFSNDVDGTANNIGWRELGDNMTDHGDDPLPPNRYFVVRNSNGAPAGNLTVVGAVLMKKLSTPLRTAANTAQDNPVCIPRPIDISLDVSGLGPTDGSFIAGDQLLIFDDAQSGFDKSPAVYYYDTTAGNRAGWRLSGDDSAKDHGRDLIRVGTGFIIRKAITFDSRTVFWTNAFPLPLAKTVSRMTHGSAGTFDIDLSLIGPRGVECRSGGANGNYSIVFSFVNDVTSCGSAGTVGGTVVAGPNTNQCTENLTGVSNAQYIDVALNNVVDSQNNNGNVSVSMGVLLGDVDTNGIVSNTDVAEVKAQITAPVDSSNFRDDVNANGIISNTDVALTKAQVGTTLP